MSHDYAFIAAQFPRYIPFPMIERLHRSGKMILAEVKTVDDLPSRLIFGDLVRESFMSLPNGWSVQFRDAHDNGLDISVDSGRFTAKPRFLGSEGLSVGPAAHKQAFGHLLNLAADQWDGALKRYLEGRYAIRVADPDPHQYHCLHLPDGWLKSILVPIAPEQLPALLDWHMSLADDSELGTTQTGAVSFAFNAINYVEGRCADGLDDAASLLVRSLLTSNTPLKAEVIRESSNDGTSAWTVRRDAYLYRCTAFLRDVPRIVELLSQSSLLSDDPDLCASVAPAELIFASKEARWWSLKNECRITWAFDDDQPEQIVRDVGTTLNESKSLVEQAVKTASDHADFLGWRETLEQGIREASNEVQP
jgi:hypothetical protein